MDKIDIARPGAFWLYLRTSIQNRLVNTAGDSARRPSADVSIESAALVSPGQDEDKVLSYEKGLESLTDDERAVIVLRLEFGFSHEEVAIAMGWPSADAARMRATRAVAELARYMS